MTVLSALAIVAIAPAVSLGAGATKIVSYRGYRLTVPASWPVYDLATDPTACVRFDRHAVYLGRPGAGQRCSAAAAGRTEAVLVWPLQTSSAGASGSGTGRALPAPAVTGAAPATGSSAQIVDRAHGVLVTATWRSDPSVIRRALGIRSLAAAARASVPRPAAALDAHPVPAVRARTAGAAQVVSLPGAAYTGLGFDACSTPSATQMADWGSSPYRAIGVYIGGANMACSQTNLTSTWTSQESAAGWHLIPIYVGLQAPGNSCGCAAISPASAAGQGTSAAADAVVQAQAIGLGTGNPVYFDMEAYTRGVNSTTVLTFLAAWTAQLHASGYLSGVYSSAGSGIVDLVAQLGTGYLEPDDIWVANWNGTQSTADPSLPAVDWSQHQRLHQYSGSHNETYGGVTINIDDDYVDSATAAAGTATPGSSAHTAPVVPTLSVAAAADGTIDLRPSWSGTSPVSSWQVLAGSSAATLSPVTGPINAGAALPIAIRSTYGYFAVVAMDANGNALGTSQPVATPAHVAIFGGSAFVSPRGIGAVPVGCYGAGACLVTTTIWAGSRLLVTTGPEYVQVGGGLTYFHLPSVAESMLLHAAGRKLAVRIKVRASAGETATRSLSLMSFRTSGAGPARSLGGSSSISLVGATDFVSHGWVGGLLAGCFASTPCTAAVTVTAGGQVVARSAAQTLGIDELGYVMFTLTPAGHRMLARTTGNQLAANVAILPGSAASAGATSPPGAGAGIGGPSQIALIAY